MWFIKFEIITEYCISELLDIKAVVNPRLLFLFFVILLAKVIAMLITFII